MSWLFRGLVWLKNELAAERREIEQTAQSGQGFLGKQEQASAAAGEGGWGRLGISGRFSGDLGRWGAAL